MSFSGFEPASLLATETDDIDDSVMVCISYYDGWRGVGRHNGHVTQMRAQTTVASLMSGS